MPPNHPQSNDASQGRLTYAPPSPFLCGQNAEKRRPANRTTLLLKVLD